ncbi:hypothetical protein FNF29_04818 [Cafeteria roenbergensis]|uniref:Uncharacterized protein n=2 Tax=Cafeteria roenbergensis TaxID=33653 RepID=A0A5A8CER7_CAFRO|nr:hypothetical protein FNF29_04818 [Cafeteria roenbergensis]|eukprot:KAA0151127.1 hypothetical protein FNF29_04818 [Cafeteria roenbergensis]
MGCALSSGSGPVAMEGMRTIVFAKDGKSILEADDKGAGRAEDAAFPSNFVRVSKYSSYLMLLLSFTFTDFFLQAANIYFLLIGVLQLIPSISITAGLPTTWGPLGIVYLVSLGRELLEERSRRAEQRSVNEEQRTAVLRPGASEFKDMAWQDVKVGDIVRVEADAFFPADLIMLGAVHAAEAPAAGDDDSDSAAAAESEKARRAKMTACHVDTASLDGESNLKKFVAVSPVTAQLVQDEALLVSAAITARLGPCMRDLAKVEGSLLAAQGTGPKSPTSPPAGADAPPIAASTKGNACVLLRECRLRNCERVYGLVAYTGPETFIKQQAKKTPAKPVFLSSAINAFVRIMLAVQIILCLVGATGFTLFASMDGPSHWYLGLEFSGVDFLLRFLTYMQISSNIIPISLYVSMEMARFAQRFFMERDDDMLLVTPDATEPNIPCKVRSLQLNDQLGQVTHIFSDKTGTLTRNSFEFRKLSVGGRCYGSGTTEIAVIAARGRAKTAAERKAAAAKGVLLQRGLDAMSLPGKVPHVNFLEGAAGAEDDGDSDGAFTLAAALQAETPFAGPDGTDRSLEHAMELDEFLTALILNSTIDIEPAESESGSYKLAGDSSDEVCFGYAASAFGYKLVRRGFSATGFPTVEIDAPPLPGSGDDAPRRRIVRHLLHVNEFNSARGMMSVVVEDPTQPEESPERVTVYAKGSDKKILPQLYRLPDFGAMAVDAGKMSDPEAAAAKLAEARRHASQALMREHTGHACVAWSEDGFRTLAFAYRRISMADFMAWLPKLKAARQRGRDEAQVFLSAHPDDDAGASKIRARATATATAELEKDLTYHGVVGYEDSLQEGVPDSVARLSDAGIKVVMLTGDKEGTALNIGYGVQMLTNETEVLSLTFEGKEAALFGHGATALEAMAPAREQLAVLANAFQRGRGAAGEEDEEAMAERDEEDAEAGGASEAARVAVYAPPSSKGLTVGSQGGASSSGIGQAAAAATAPRMPHDAKATEAAIAEAPASPATPVTPVSPITPIGPADPATLIRLGSEPSMQRAVALLSPQCTESGIALPLAARRALDLVEALQAELDRVTTLLQSYLDGGVTDEAAAARLRRDVIHFALSIDAVLHAVRFRAGTSRPLALVLDERAMTFFLDWPGYAEIEANPAAFDPVDLEMKASKRLCLLALMQQCTSIIGARCQPAQKRTVLELFKEEVPGACCVGIGDGANDVEMINAANIGVGIKGVEGNSAANSADYAIGQFRFLQRLLLVHGRWNYRRMALLVLFLFYKNALFTVAQFLFGIDSAWSGQKLYGEVANQAYNLFFTGAAVVAVAVLDQDVDQDSAQRFPSLYNDGRRRLLFNPVIATAWLLNAVAEATIIYLIVVNTVGASEPDGFANSIFEMGAVALTLVIAVVNLRLAAETYQHEWVFIALSFLSTASWPGLAFAADALDVDRTLGLMAKVWSSPMAWLLIPVGVFIVMTPVIVAKVCISIFMPSYATVVRETEFFIRKGQQSLQFAPMVETAETVKLRLQGKLTPEARRLRRASGLFDRANFATKTTIRMERGLDRVKEQATVSAHGVADSSSGTVSSKSRRFQDDGGGALVQAGNSSALSLVRRAAERRDGRPKKAATSVVSRRSSRVAPTPPPTGHRAELLRWAEQEALLILHPIEAELEERLRGETRTRLSYPFHFYRSVAMRKRIANLVQQGRIPAEAVGLRALPDDDVVFGEGADGQLRQEPGAARGDGAAAAASAAAGQAPGAAAPKPEGGSEQWKALRMAMRLSAIAKELAEGGADYRSTVGRSGDLRHARKAAKGRHRYTASQANRAAQRWATLRHGSRDIRAEFAVDESGQSGRAQQVQESVSRALHRAATSGRATTGQLGAGWRLPAPRRSAGGHSHSRKAATDAGASSAAAAAAAAAGPRTDPASMTSAGADLGARASDQATVSGAAGVGHE